MRKYQLDDFVVSSYFAHVFSMIRRYLARELVYTYPVTRTPLIWLIDRILPLLFLYNASGAFLRVRWANLVEDVPSTVAIPVPTTQQPASSNNASSSSSTSVSTPIRINPISSATYKSSPKTRPSPAAAPSPRLTRSSALPNNTPSSTHNISTPPKFFNPSEGTGESPTAALRRSLLASANANQMAGTDSPFGSSGRNTTSMPSGMSTSLFGASPSRDVPSPRVQAYRARHEPVACEFQLERD